MTDLVERELIERLRADAHRQDGEEESIVSTNCMRNAADALEALSERIVVLEAQIDRAVSGGLPEQLLLDADELEACGAGNEAKRMRELVDRLKEFRRSSLTQEPQ